MGKAGESPPRRPSQEAQQQLTHIWQFEPFPVPVCLPQTSQSYMQEISSLTARRTPQSSGQAHDRSGGSFLASSSAHGHSPLRRQTPSPRIGGQRVRVDDLDLNLSTSPQSLLSPSWNPAGRAGGDQSSPLPGVIRSVSSIPEGISAPSRLRRSADPATLRLFGSKRDSQHPSQKFGVRDFAPVGGASWLGEGIETRPSLPHSNSLRPVPPPAAAPQTGAGGGSLALPLVRRGQPLPGLLWRRLPASPPPRSARLGVPRSLLHWQLEAVGKAAPPPSPPHSQQISPPRPAAAPGTSHPEGGGLRAAAAAAPLRAPRSHPCAQP